MRRPASLVPPILLTSHQLYTIHILPPLCRDHTLPAAAKKIPIPIIPLHAASNPPSHVGTQLVMDPADVPLHLAKMCLYMSGGNTKSWAHFCADRAVTSNSFVLFFGTPHFPPTLPTLPTLPPSWTGG